MKRMGWLLVAARNPVETILFIFSLSLMVYSLFVMSPLYAPDYNAIPTGSVVAEAFPSRANEFILASLFLLTSIPGLIAPFVEKPRLLYLKLSSFGMFLSFTFLTILRLVIYGIQPLTWLNLLAVALACGVFRLYLEVQKK